MLAALSDSGHRRPGDEGPGAAIGGEPDAESGVVGYFGVATVDHVRLPAQRRPNPPHRGASVCAAVRVVANLNQDGAFPGGKERRQRSHWVGDFRTELPGQGTIMADVKSQVVTFLRNA